MIVLYILAQVVRLALELFLLAMLVRAVYSWFVHEETALMAFLLTITEPIILPFRILTSKIRAFQTLPIDIAYMMAYIAVSILVSILPPISL